MATNPALCYLSGNGTPDGENRDGAFVATVTGALRYRTGFAAGRRAFFMEETTTNLLPNPRAGTNLSSLIASTGVTLTRLTDRTINHPDDFVLDTAVEAALGATFAGPDVVQQSLVGEVLTQGNEFHGQVLIRAPTGNGAVGKTAQLLLTELGGAQAAAFMGSTGVTLTADWQLLTVGGSIAEADRTNVRLDMRITNGADGDVIEVTAMDVEDLTVRTSYVDGSLGDGYAWTGTAHASTSTRTFPLVRLPMPPGVDPQRGSVAVRVRRSFDNETNQYVLTLGQRLANHDWLGLLDRTVTFSRVRAQWWNQVDPDTAITSPSVIATGVWHVIYTDWDGLTTHIAVDDEDLLAGTRNAVHDDFGTVFDIGAAWGQQLGGWIQDVMVFDRPLTQEERTILATAPGWSFGILLPPGPPVIGTGGSTRFSTQLYRATKTNQRVEDLSSFLIDGEVTVNFDRAIRLAAKFRLRDLSAVAALSDYLAPVIRLDFTDGSPPIERQVGLFLLSLPDGTYTLETGEGVVEGRDLTALLADSSFRDVYTVPVSTNFVAAMITLAATVGITRTAIPATTHITTEAISFPVGMTRLEAINSLAQAIGYYHVWAENEVLVTGPSQSLAATEPYARYTAADLVKPVNDVPTTTTLANVIIVQKDNPGAAPLSAIRVNDDPASPVSTVTLGREITRHVDDPNLVDQAAVDALADLLFEESGSYYQALEATISPDPRLPVHPTIDLQFDPPGQCFCGRYWVRTWRMGLRAADSAVQLDLNQVVVFGHEEAA